MFKDQTRSASGCVEDGVVWGWGGSAPRRSEDASLKSWTVVIPVTAWAGGLGAAMPSGQLPDSCLCFARLAPTEALRTV
jgi:hypothetical protein